MPNSKAIILEGSSGLSFFFHEILLGHRIVDHVDLVSTADEAIDLIAQSEPYELVVINLVESWGQGLQLGYWLRQHPSARSVIFIIPPETPRPFFADSSFVVLQAPLTLDNFIQGVRTALDQKTSQLQETKNEQNSYRL